jgi:cell division septum initiation protein DivIVA
MRKLSLISILFVMLAGCASTHTQPTLINSHPNQKPDWVLNKPDNTRSQYYFVGVSGKALSRKKARLLATAHAFEKVARYSGVRINSLQSVLQSSSRRANRIYNPNKEKIQQVLSEAQARIKGFEKTAWYIEDWGQFYRAYVLMEVPSSTVTTQKNININRLKQKQQRLKNKLNRLKSYLKQHRENEKIREQIDDVEDQLNKKPTQHRLSNIQDRIGRIKENANINIVNFNLYNRSVEQGHIKKSLMNSINSLLKKAKNKGSSFDINRDNVKVQWKDDNKVNLILPVEIKVKESYVQSVINELTPYHNKGVGPKEVLGDEAWVHQSSPSRNIFEKLADDYYKIALVPYNIGRVAVGLKPYESNHWDEISNRFVLLRDAVNQFERQWNRLAFRVSLKSIHNRVLWSQSNINLTEFYGNCETTKLWLGRIYGISGGELHRVGSRGFHVRAKLTLSDIPTSVFKRATHITFSVHDRKGHSYFYSGKCLPK